MALDAISRQKLSCRTVAAGRFEQLNYVRNLPPLSVEERFGPPDEVPAATPSETLLTALGSCLSARINANAASASIVVRQLELECEVDVQSSSLWDPPGQGPRPVGFESIRVIVTMDADASPEALRALIAHAVLWSPVANTLHGPVHLDVELEGNVTSPAIILDGPESTVADGADGLRRADGATAKEPSAKTGPVAEKPPSA